MKGKSLDRAERDKFLVLQILKGDKSSFTELMERYYDAIYFTLLKMVKNKQTAEDLTLEVFSKAYNNIGQYTQNWAFSTWLFKIATNHGIDFLRKNNTIEISIDEGDNKNQIALPDSVPGPEEELIQQQNADELKKMVNALKPFWKKLIELRYFHELSYDEIAIQMDLPMGTVKSQLYRAKEQLYKDYLNKRR